MKRTLAKKRVLRINPNKLVLVTTDMKSQGVKNLANELSDQLGYKVWRVEPGREKGRKAFALRKGTPKTHQLQQFRNAGVPCPDFTTDLEEARGWAAEGTVMCRKLVMGHSGQGIVIAETPDEVVRAPLYTKYMKKKHEYRVHVVNGEAIDVQQKRKRRGHEGERETKIRNLANGYVYCRDGITEPEGMRQIALDAVRAVGYNMGAVDIAYNERNNQCLVLEVNARPGLTGTTAVNYANAIKKVVR